MGATIHYRNASKQDPSLDVNAPSSFIDALEKAFGKLPIVLGREHKDILFGMSVNSRGESGYEDLMDKIERFGVVEVYASW